MLQKTNTSSSRSPGAVLISLTLSIISVFMHSSAYAQVEAQQSADLTVSADFLSSLVFYPARSAPASVLSLNNSRIPAEISAVITSIKVRVGDIVAAGDLLAELDCRQTQLNYEIENAQIAQLRAALDLEKRELERREKLVAGGNIGESVYDRSQTDVLSREQQLLAQTAVLDIAKLNVQRCSITAPYAGVIALRIANEGESLSMGSPVVQLVQLDELEVMANIALGDVESFGAANEYFFQENDEVYPVTIRSLLPVIENNVRIREARFVFDDAQAIAGSSGRLLWESPISHVPARFLQRRDDIPGIFVVENNRAKFIVLEDAEEGRPVPFEMDGTTLLITDGRFGLVDGQPINVR